MALVKICGIQTLEHAQAAIHAGADAIGFVFAESKRQVNINQACEIVQALPPSIKKVGVFVNASKDKLEAITHEVGLDYVQLHGDESSDFCETLAVPYIKALRINDEHDLFKLKDYEGARYYLLDSATGPYQGGNGTSFDWSLLKNKEIERDRFILAGGLNENNVQEAIEQSQPVMVDVSSGVETDGVKDPVKIKNFIQKAKERLK